MKVNPFSPEMIFSRNIGKASFDFSNMAAPMDWRKTLNNHKIFCHLRELKDKIQKEEDCQRWMVVYDGQLYLWNPYKAVVHTANIRSLSTSGNVSENRTDNDATLKHGKFQVPHIFLE